MGMSKFFLSIVCITIAISLQGQSAKKRKLNVAILLYEGVELFDFAGPGEVFSVAGYFSTYENFDVFTVSGSGETLVSQRFLSITPNYSVANAPKPDIIILPGGNSKNAYQDEKVMNWLGAQYDSTRFLLTVCTGVFILEKTGQLKGHRATTHWGANYSLSEKEGVEVISEVKFIDSGKIITSGGVSSGTEGALHLVQKISGIRAAQEVARYMEYDNWKPNLGLIDYENPYTGLNSLNDINKSISAQNEVYYGEVEMAGYHFLDENKHDFAKIVFECLSDQFPEEPSNFNNLSKVYKAMGMDAPLSQDEFKKEILNGNYAKVKVEIERAKAKWPEWVLFDQNRINNAGYNLLAEKKVESAIDVFEIVVMAFPESANAYDSLAEGYMLAGNRELAISNYEKSLVLNPKNNNASSKLKELTLE